MELKVIERKPFKLMGKAYIGKVQFNESWMYDIFQELYEKIDEIIEFAKRKKNGGLAGFWGVCTSIDKDISEAGNDGKYIAGCVVSDNAPVKEGWEILQMPESKYAIVKCNPSNYVTIYQDAFKDYFNKGVYKVKGLVQLYYDGSETDGSFFLCFPIE